MTARTGDGWEVVDFLTEFIETVRDEPQFTDAEHALMGAGEMDRAGLLRQEPPTREEIARAMEEKHRVEPLGDADHHHGCVCGGWDDSWDCAETWDEHYADAVLELLAREAGKQ